MIVLLLACSSNAAPELPVLAGGPGKSGGAPASPLPTYEAPDNAAFWAAWGDGKAEISSYTLRQPRYGEVRDGTAVLIFVTEDFSWSERVKADPGQHPASDLRPVLKLNATRDFVTGVYPYHTMTSVFARVDPGDGMRALDPLKITSSTTEWCGMVYDEWVPDAGRVRLVGHTYFDGDTRPAATVQTGNDLVYGDTIPLLVRGLRGDRVAPGATATFPYLDTQLALRFAHEPPRIGQVTVTRGEPKRVDVPASGGQPAASYEVDVWTFAVGPSGNAAGTRPPTTTTWFVESTGARRIVGWESSTGESAWLRASARLPYWQLNRPGDESWRVTLGI